MKIQCKGVFLNQKQFVLESTAMIRDAQALIDRGRTFNVISKFWGGWNNSLVSKFRFGKHPFTPTLGRLC